MLLFLSALAYAQDATTVQDLPSFLLTLGPAGALAGLAFMVGKGLNVKLTVEVELSEKDRELLTRALDRRES